MYINKVHCLFEQSGTFKNAFKKLGIDAEDYDISNDFEQTDNVIDLFGEIEKAYKEEKSIFDNIKENDLVFAFFPCTRFEAKVPLLFRGEAFQQKNWTNIEKLEYSKKLHEELSCLYNLIAKLFIVSLRGGWKMIVENPSTAPHYLTMFFPIKPTIIDKDRTKNGDYYKKPTQYWFVNCRPEYNLCMMPLDFVEQSTVDKAKIKGHEKQSKQVRRSLIHPQYAYRFILENIIDISGKVVTEEVLEVQE